MVSVTWWALWLTGKVRTAPAKIVDLQCANLSPVNLGTSWSPYSYAFRPTWWLHYTYLIGDGLGNGVPVGWRIVPVRLADEQDHAGSDTYEETERRAETQSRHLEHGLVLYRHDQVLTSRTTITTHVQYDY